MTLRFHSLFVGAVALGSLTALLSAAIAETSTAQHNWPQWRGPLATGEAPEASPPVTWSEAENVKWKVKLPGRGTATPVVWGDKIFIQTAIATGKKADPAPAADAAANQPAVGNQEARRDDPPPAGRAGRRGPGERGAGGPAGRGPGGFGGGRGGRGGGFGSQPPTEVHQFVLLCLDRATGKTLWQKVAREELPHEGHHRDHGFASHSPATDGQHVIAYFGSRGLHCYDMNGNLQWSKDLGRMQTKLGFGEGSSPVLYGNTIVVNWDHEGDDFIAAFDKTTGNELWREPRDEDTTWGTPLVVEHNGSVQVVIGATNSVRSYDLRTGKQIWEADGLTQNAIPSPVALGDMVFLTAGHRGSELKAIRLGATGDLTGTDSIVWRLGRGTPYVPSPLLYQGKLYFFTSNNPILTCYDAKTGEPIAEGKRIEGLNGVYASPVAADGRVYLVGRNGTTVVIKHADRPVDDFDVLATNELDEPIDASPAVVGRELFLRGHEHLYCIAEK